MSTLSDMAASIERLEAENAELRKDLQQERNYLEFERNKYERLFKAQGQGYAKELKDTIELELLSIRDICENVPEFDKRRILRRLDRINQYLEEFGVHAE
jgi:dsDNA-specific endonuclease/ATPase MutS2